jgi:hypothetical protein
VNITWSIVISGIALVVSVLSPLLSTIASNRHQRKMNRMEFFDKHRAEVIEGYLKYASIASAMRIGIPNEYFSYYSEIFLYAPEPLIDDIKKIDVLVCGNESERAEGRTLIAAASVKLRDYPPRLEHKRGKN